MKHIDKFANNAYDLKNKKLFLFDMDGTIYNENILFDGTKQIMEHIKKIGGHYVFITNNSSKSVTDYVKKVSSMGIPASYDNFFTSSQVTLHYLHKKYPGQAIYCMGTQSMIEELTLGGIKVHTEVSNEAKVILVGFDTEITSEKIRNTCEMLKRDLPYLATNPDLVCPVSFGFIPDCGAICKMLEYATKKYPEFLGKPNKLMIDLIAENFGYELEETVVIGDRLYTDIALGLNAGTSAVCVLTGEATIDEINSSSIKPTYTFDSIYDIYNLLINT